MVGTMRFNLLRSSLVVSMHRNVALGYGTAAFQSPTEFTSRFDFREVFLEMRILPGFNLLRSSLVVSIRLVLPVECSHPVSISYGVH